MGPEAHASLLVLVSTYHTLILSLSLVVLGVLILMLWFRIYRSNNYVKELILKSMEAGKARGTRLELICEDTKRQAGASVDELQRLIAEERSRINTMQKMLIELKEKQLANNRITEKSLQTVINQLSERMDFIEKRLPYASGRLGFPGQVAQVADESGEKGKFLV